ncbi:MAG TPA: hypothetical protein VE155_01115 [Pseudonocardiaceae bacterium]|nr:hypothetical protein [Pseudonocardiaceae bacterium]
MVVVGVLDLAGLGVAVLRRRCIWASAAARLLIQLSTVCLVVGFSASALSRCCALGSTPGRCRSVSV